MQQQPQEQQQRASGGESSRSRGRQQRQWRWQQPQPQQQRRKQTHSHTWDRRVALVNVMHLGVLGWHIVVLTLSFSSSECSAACMCATLPSMWWRTPATYIPGLCTICPSLTCCVPCCAVPQVEDPSHRPGLPPGHVLVVMGCAACAGGAAWDVCCRCALPHAGCGCTFQAHMLCCCVQQWSCLGVGQGPGDSSPPPAGLWLVRRLELMLQDVAPLGMFVGVVGWGWWWG